MDSANLLETSLPVLMFSKLSVCAYCLNDVLSFEFITIVDSVVMRSGTPNLQFSNDNVAVVTSLRSGIMYYIVDNDSDVLSLEKIKQNRHTENCTTVTLSLHLATKLKLLSARNTFLDMYVS